MFHETRALLVLSLLLAGCSAAAQTSPSSAAPLNTTVRSLQAGQVVDGVPCLIEDLPQHHIHVHLQILYNGLGVAVPAGIGVGRPWGIDATGFITTGGCFAWIHTHDATGVVHVVTPEEKSFTLGQLFEVWGQPLGVASALGHGGSLVVLVNGQRFDGDPRAVRLGNLENIVLELGKPPAVPPPALYNFAAPRM
jgi:hypothetical protein